MTAPPGYSEQHANVLATTFGNLNLTGEATKTPQADACLAHLRLLYAFERLKSETGYQDGLWDIWDSRAGGPTASNAADILVKLREKRWAVYVARAVDRYEAWWKSFVPRMLKEKETMAGEGADQQRYEGFTENKPTIWNEEMLPPLDVLLVWHAHMLNPRLYLEDCLRYGYGSLWAAGMPWKLVNEAISDDFSWTEHEGRKASWTSRTDRTWDNRDDPQEKALACPACSTENIIPWTTCGLPLDYKGDRRPGLAGEGFGDGELKHKCQKCNFAMTHDTLRFSKFQKDAKLLVMQDQAMPGTILDLKSGLPVRATAKKEDRLFPSRLLQRGLLAEITELANSDGSMKKVKDLIENATADYTSGKTLRRVDDKKGFSKLKDVTTVRTNVSLTARRQTRKMMSRYWQNSSLAALDLCGAVIRQGVFSEKMCKIDWLHSPNSRATIDRLLAKYYRYIDIIASYPDQSAVPTLDVDLAWHTHQLSPQSYFNYTVKATGGVFIDHNDRVDEDKLSTAFEWTCKVYMEKYGEPYSECTCWYCESVRVMNISGVSKMFRTSKEEKSLDQWHSSGASARVPQPPAAHSAHLSSHPSVQVNETIGRRAHTRSLRINHHNKLQEAHSKAVKKGSQRQMGPRGKDEVEFWGKTYTVESPVRSSLAKVSTSVMYASSPGVLEMEKGACAHGTCGGSGGCASETLGMCTAGCTGTGKGGVGMGVCQG